jgi:DnaA family protein
MDAGMPEPEPYGDSWAAVLLDEVHLYSPVQQHAAFTWFVNAQTHQRWVLAAGDQPPALLQVRDDLRTRLGWGLVYQLHALSDEEKLAALRAHVYARGVHLAEDLLPYLLTHLPRDLRSLTAALDALDAFALARQRALTVPLLKEWLAQAPGASALRP